MTFIQDHGIVRFSRIKKRFIETFLGLRSLVHFFYFCNSVFSVGSRPFVTAYFFFSQ